MGFYRLQVVLRNITFTTAFYRQIKWKKFHLPSKAILSSSFKTHGISNKLHTTQYQNLCSNCTSNEIEQLADSILSQHFELNDVSKRNELIKVLDFLVSQGCTIRDIRKYCLHFLKPSNSSYVKVVQIAELGSDILKLIPFMKLSLVSLRRAALQAKEDKHQIPDFSNRILYLSHHLESPIEELIPALTKHSSLLTMQFIRLHHKMDVLKNAEISAEDLVKDLWIFNYNETLLVDRITAAEKAGVKLKPWMLRCSRKFFISRLKKDSETQRILEGNDIVNYLSKKLDCNEEYVKFMMEKNKFLNTINIPKIEQIINFLFKKGYTTQEIRLVPRVFSSKIETLDQRFQEYLKIRGTLPPIPQLCLTSKKYLITMEKLQKCESL